MSDSKPLPHRYVVSSTGTPTGPLSVSSPKVEDLAVAAPAEFGGPGNLWSPETLFVSAIASCFELSFRAIARASRLDWSRLHCEAEAVLDRVDETGKAAEGGRVNQVVRFTEVLLRARLMIPDEKDMEKAKRLLAKVENTCLVTNSIVCSLRVEAQIDVA